MSIQRCHDCDKDIDTDFDVDHFDECVESSKNVGTNNPNYRHGMAGTRPYNIWGAMKKRCYSKIKNYGERGICYDKKWEKFENFWEDMHEGYSDNLSIDRIDNNGNYFKENCRWATKIQQANNTRGNRHVVVDGVKKSLTDWCKEKNMCRDTFYFRVKKKGMSEEMALKTPVDDKKSMAGQTSGKYNQ